MASDDGDDVQPAAPAVLPGAAQGAAQGLTRSGAAYQAPRAGARRDLMSVIATPRKQGARTEAGEPVYYDPGSINGHFRTSDDKLDLDSKSVVSDGARWLLVMEAAVACHAKQAVRVLLDEDVLEIDEDADGMLFACIAHATTGGTYRTTTQYRGKGKKPGSGRARCLLRYPRGSRAKVQRVC